MDPEIVTIELTDEEFSQLRTDAQEAGCSISELVKKRFLEAGVKIEEAGVMQ